VARIAVSAEGTVEAPADTVYRYIADMREHHPRFLPPAFSDFRVESGGVGAGTILRYKLTAGGRTREYRTKIAEPEPGRVLTESDTGSSAVTTFTVSPQGPASLVQISGTWDGAGGSAACSSAYSRRGCCVPSIPMSSSGSTPTRVNAAPHEPATLSTTLCG
jgi:hypothetical protein